MIKTFKGKLNSDDAVRIRIGTKDGETGYKIRNLEIIGELPGQQTVELVTKVYTVPPEKDATGAWDVDGAIDFNDPTLIAVAYLDDSSSTGTPFSHRIIMDNVKVNQDLYVTTLDVSGSSRATNFYLEMEQMKLAESEAAIATLKDIRGRE